MIAESQSIDVLRLRRGLPSILRNHNILTVGDLLAHCVGMKQPPLFVLPSIGELSYQECVVKAAKYLALERWRLSREDKS